MPELPEVESLVAGIRSELLGRSVTRVVFYRPDIREKIPQRRIKQILLNKEITAVLRRGKYFLVGTDEGFLGAHLGMSGRFVKASLNTPLAPHTHALFEINSGIQFRFVDPRRFGRLFSVEKDQLFDHPYLAKLGVEPLDSKVNLANHFFTSSRGRTQSVKNFLMDSHVVVGVGNIYASESLWHAKIHPERRSCDLTLPQYESLSEAVTQVLRQAILAGGTTFRDYRDKDGNPGYFQQNLAVYAKVTNPCPRCSTPIVKTTSAGRSTFFCPLCQNAKNA